MRAMLLGRPNGTSSRGPPYPTNRSAPGTAPGLDQPPEFMQAMSRKGNGKRKSDKDMK